MVEIIEIAGSDLDQNALDLALSEYQNFRGSEDYDEKYKWDVLEELQDWISEHEINEDTVGDFVEKIKKENLQQGSDNK